MKLSELIQTLPFISLTEEAGEIEITAIYTDSRQVTPGSLFICIEGFQTDGHLYVQDAIEKGARVIIAEKEVESKVPVIYVNDSVRALAIIASAFYDSPTTALPLIGITGTNGKTTVSYLLDAIYNHFGKKTGVIGTIHNKVGERLKETNNTTPDALILQQLFHDMRNSGVEQVIMEVSSHGLDLGRVYGCDFDTVIFTNLSQDHLDYHKNEFNYFFAKSQLFSRLGNTYDGRRKYSIINADDKYVGMLKKTSAFPTITYGIDSEADVMADDIELSQDCTIFQLKTPVGTVKITSRLTGKFNIYNMLAAASAALINDIPLHIIKDTLQVVPPIPGRFETVDFGQPFGVIVDYAHTPHAVKNILETCKELKTGKLYCVLGCGGDRDPAKRPLMAREAVWHADYAIFTSDNPRTEDPRAIIDDMVQALDGYEQTYEIIIDRKAAIEKAMSIAEAGDLVVIAGKGHETYQEIAGEKYPFDDRIVAKNAFLNKEF
ncbi:UDP-N-acetylmuramoyl-L-alanyl-D-glutamate--2,6-diaminopimelate ligase [Oceanobacillus indicireducens]|uniref:UDP-N-acetylmuramoyl-L-alanyl-D-glutamate--2,6-diaminopimelate ligase n=1 Tax=Oceanobacillus indicireducens TaxID=1004261 RepID=A0A917XR35_9BACI|nr:UDP-N-acetylmuramoyl-L-alanyl-D-glutamate--2,6-diaminopimelate ligase [Oceanobacillus indicireducens]GGN49258.1 UDP-N-acetylmuramoyl-L-alanyl-D-glutamate--2,6-diaminopimelate ligase [Oceanobacillus indicireducens]